MSPLVLKKGIREKSPYSPRSLLGNSARWVEVKRDEIEGRSATLSFNHLIQSKETNSYREGERGGGGGGETDTEKEKESLREGEKKERGERYRVSERERMGGGER